jgi:hypothetical protein
VEWVSKTLLALHLLQKEAQIKVPISIVAMQKRGWRGVSHDKELLYFPMECCVVCCVIIVFWWEKVLLRCVMAAMFCIGGRKEAMLNFCLLERSILHSDGQHLGLVFRIEQDNPGSGCVQNKF